ncbi:hypothetical protein [Alloprevotella tannerae]
MKKNILIAIVALFANASVAYSQETGTIAPKPAYTCDFENAETTKFVDQVITINGKRWRLHNARITDSSINGIPQGKRAVEILSGTPNGEPACLELLDTIRGGSFAFCFGHSGMDRTISKSSEAWFVEVTEDDGNNWMAKPLIFDATDVTPMMSFDSPYYGDPFRFRIRFTDKRGFGSNWRILIDNIFVTQGENIEVPWYVQPGRIFDGFETSQDSINFIPLMSGCTFFFGEKDSPYADTYLQTRVDENEPTNYYIMPENIHFAAKHLSEGKHHFSIQFMRTADNKPWDGSLQTNFDFYVRPVSGTIKGIAALRGAEVGKFYDLVPNGNDSIYVNWIKKTRAQKWLFDGKAGILVDDPNYIDFVPTLSPNDQIVKKMRGQLLEVDNNLIFRLDSKPEIEDVANTDFHFRNYVCDNLSILSRNPAIYQAYPLALTGVKLVKSFYELDHTPNGRIEIQDLKGNHLFLQNIYPDNFQTSQFLEAGTEHFIIYGMVGRSYIDDQLCFYPLSVQADPTADIDGITNTVAATPALSISHSTGYLSLQSTAACSVVIYDLNGNVAARLSLEAGAATAVSLGHGLFIATAHYKDGSKSSVKFVN